VNLFLGVDGGKSKTIGLLADAQGKILGWGRSGNSDKYAVSEGQALDEIGACVSQAYQRAGLAIHPAAAGCFGLAGADWPEDFIQLEAGLNQRKLANQLVVKNDAQIALRANTRDGIGVVISAGTHLAAAIRTPRNEEWFSGWYSVEGPGGAKIGYRVLWAVLHNSDGRGPQTALTQLVLSQTNKSTPLELLRDLSSGKLDEAFFSSLAPLLFKAYYEMGDSLAAQMIQEIGEEMSLWATGLLTRFDLLQREIPIILSGGLFKSQGELLIDTLRMHIHAQAPRARIALSQYEPVTGALLYAYEVAGIDISSEILAMINKTMPESAVFRTDGTISDA